MATKLVPLLLLASCALTLGESAPHSIQKRSGMKLCGRMLVEALAAVCQNEYYDPNHVAMQRKSQTADKRNYGLTVDSYPMWESGVVDADGFLDAQTALAFLTNGQLPRGVRGVADECCRKSCSYQQLLSYCGPAIVGQTK